MVNNEGCQKLNLFICILIMPLLLHSYVKSQDPCEDRNLIGAVGGAVTLHVSYTGVRKMIWSFGKITGAIATTIPKEAIEIENKSYKGKLSSTSDGSLIITELRLEDQGTYQAQITIGEEKLSCNFHLTVFSNLTAEDVTISSNVTDNKTCEVSLMCSVNRSNVTITWRSINSSDINSTRNFVFVPHSNVHFTYICKAENPVSNVSKAVHPWEYCERDKKNTDPKQDYERNYIGSVVAFIFVFIAVSGGVSGGVWFYHRKYQNVNQEQKVEEGRKKYKVKDKQDSKMCLVNTVYSQIQLPQNAGSETPNVEQSTPSRERGTAGMSNDPQAMELQESNEIIGNTLYSTVQHVKQKNNTTKQPCPSNGKPSKAPPKPPHKVLEPPKGKIDQVESCYAEVQLPKDKSDQKSPSKGLNGDHSMAPMESCYAQVQLPKNCETQYGQVQGTGSKSSNE